MSKPPSVLWRHYVNPCDIDRHPALAPLGDALTAVYHATIESTDCPCCRAIRVLVVIVFSFAIGLLL